MTCEIPMNPPNGVVMCSGQPVTVGETCTTQCNTGYELQGGDEVRICQSDTTFSGTEATCRRGT